MNLAQHILVFTGIILGLAVSDLTISFHRLMIARKRVRWYWPSLALAMFQLASLIQVFWVDYSIYTTVKNLTIQAFLPDVGLRILMFLMTAAVLPDEVPDGEFDLRDYYWEQARYYWSLSAIMLSAIFVVYAPRTTMGTTLSDFIDQWWTNGLSLAIAITLILSRREWLHKLLIGVVLLLAAWAYLGQTIG